MITKMTKEKYKRIIDEWFVNGFHGINAYKKFYSNVKDETAKVNFSRMYALPEMKGYIQSKHEEAAKIVKATHEGILKELQNWVEADITETINLTAEQIKELPIEIRRLITKYKVISKNYYDKDGNLSQTVSTIELQFVSKEKAIDMINKHLGFYEADNNQKTSDIHIYTSSEKHKDLIESILEGG